MSCNNCSSSSKSYNVSSLYSPNCNECSEGCGECVDTKCITYKGPNLPCSLVMEGDTIEVALEKLDAKLCEASGDYTSYNVNCLAGDEPILTEEQFVDAITLAHCNLATTVSTFLNTTFPEYQTEVDYRFIAIEHPGIICSSAGVLESDTLQEVLAKYCTKFESLDDELDLSNVDWNQCFTVATLPTTLTEAFDAIIDMVCAGGIIVPELPLFNNLGTCLATPTGGDSLEDTIIKIRTRLCQTPTFDINTLSWGCTAKPSIVPNDLQAAFQSLLDQVDDYLKNKLTFSSDFVVGPTSASDPCLGKSVSLSTSLAQDRFVAVNIGDTAPGTLSQKLIAGDGITLDTTTVPGTMIISSTGGSGDDYTVIAGPGDGTHASLIEKIIGSSGIVTVGLSHDPISEKVIITATVDLDALADGILTRIENNSVLKQRFCTLVASCPSPCTPPQGVQAVFVDLPTGSSSTTTTSTTTPPPPTMDVIYYGVSDSPTTPDSSTIVSTGLVTNQDGSQNVNINWVPLNITPKYCWVAIPDRTPTSVKGKWYVDIINQGNIGLSTDLFGATFQVTIGVTVYNVWITNYQTQFSGTCQLRNS